MDDFRQELAMEINAVSRLPPPTGLKLLTAIDSGQTVVDQGCAVISKATAIISLGVGVLSSTGKPRCEPSCSTESVQFYPETGTVPDIPSRDRVSVCVCVYTHMYIYIYTYIYTYTDLYI